MRLVVHRPGRDPVELESDGGAVYELGMRERDHGVPLQPYPDGREQQIDGNPAAPAGVPPLIRSRPPARS
jgi:hypothetical protein